MSKSKNKLIHNAIDGYDQIITDIKEYLPDYICDDPNEPDQLYKLWSFLKLFHHIRDIYGFELSGFYKKQNEIQDNFEEVSLDSNSEGVESSLLEYLSGQKKAVKYLGIILKKTWSPVTYKISKVKDSEDIKLSKHTGKTAKDAFIKLEYQRTFKLSKKHRIDDQASEICPDISMTTSYCENGLRKRQLYFFAADNNIFENPDFKIDHWHRVHQMFYVSWLKNYSFFHKNNYCDESGTKIMGSYILYPQDFDYEKVTGQSDDKWKSDYWYRDLNIITKKDDGNLVSTVLYDEDIRILKCKIEAKPQKDAPTFKTNKEILFSSVLCKPVSKESEYNGHNTIKYKKNDLFYYPKFGWTNEYYGRNLYELYKEYCKCFEKNSKDFKSEKAGFEQIKQRLDDIRNTSDDTFNTIRYFSGNRPFLEKDPDSGLEYKLGMFYLSPENDYPLKCLFRMILELHRPFEWDEDKTVKDKKGNNSDKILPILWNNCKICGSKIDKNDIEAVKIIKDKDSEPDRYKYTITCSKCNETWYKTHCEDSKCENGLLIKHQYMHNYLEAEGFGYVKCPVCGE